MGTIEVMRKALEALERPHAGLVPHQGEWRSRQSLAIDALRAELERLETVEPVACQACGGPATHNAEEDRTGLPGPYCNDCDPPTAAPIAPSIPAPTHEQIDEGWIQCGGSGSAYDAWHDGAHWAYTLAAARCGARIVKADTLQELADNAKQIGLEY